MTERWRKPLKVLDVQPGSEVQLVGGRLLRSTVVTYDKESTDRIRAGYACAKCMEVFERPWPEKCSVCGAPIRARQLEYFQKEFGGEVQLGSSLKLSDELARLREGGTHDS